MSTLPPPPESLTLLIEVLGLDNTLLLIEKRGGTKFYVTTGVGSSWAKTRIDLVAEFGEPMAQALIATFGGGWAITVPMAKEWRVLYYRSLGLTHNEVAFRAGVHVDTVRRILKGGERGKPRQFELPI